MVREAFTVVLLAVLAGCLAHLVAPLNAEARPPDILVASSLMVSVNVQPKSVSSAIEPWRADVPDQGSAVTEVPVLRVTVAPAPVTFRARVPVGCERLISGLVRSAAAQQIARCVT